MKKKILIAILLLAVASTCLVACTKDKGSDAESNRAYVSLDINPAIELIADGDNVVTNARGENEDGQVLLYNETGIVGEKLDVAVKKIIELSVDYGYLDEDNKAVSVLVAAQDSVNTEAIQSTVDASITATASAKGLTVSVDHEGAFSLLRRMEEVKAEYPDNAAVQNMSVQKFKLALSVSETCGISIEAAAEINDKDLIEMLKNASDNIEEFATDAYVRAKESASAAYDKAVGLALCGVYSEYCYDRLITEPLTAYYGLVYQMYSAGAVGLGYIANIADYAADTFEYPLDEATAEQVAAIFGLDSCEPLKNADGEVTLASIENYADILFKNSEAGKELETLKSELAAALNEVEAEVKTEIYKLTDEHRELIEQAVTSAKLIADGVEGMISALLDDNIEEQLRTCIADMRAVLTELNTVMANGEFSVEGLKTYVERLDGKAEEYRVKLENELSAEEVAELNEKKANVGEKLTAEKEKTEAAIREAEELARAHLAALKEARKNGAEA